MKVFAIFLPQFHTIPENDEWWGKGFTEWTNLRKGKPLFKGHKQPIHPYKNNYYNLLDKKTMIWQTNLMKKYNVDGFVYYHYYFKGKKLLEKPAENLLKWKEIEQPFFFNWANHSWLRSWNGTSEMLMEQTYGDKSDWEEHFLYLLPFFQDKRYEKIDNKPVFMIYNLNFPEKNEMFAYFDKRCKENGFNGLYLIEEFSDVFSYEKIKKEKSCATELFYLTQPLASKNLAYKNKAFTAWYIIINYFVQKKGLKYIFRFKGDNLLKKTQKYLLKEKDIINGIFFEWDNTCRHGYRGYIITPVSKKRLFSYMDSIKKNEYIIINAWNEWCESMILEPSEENGYKYLEWIKEWKEKNK